MTDINDAQLRRLDVTLLLVFEEILRSGKLSAAAKRLGLTQSAISHALKRLRDIFADDLFSRTPHGVTPTPRALALRTPIAEALRLLDSTLRPAQFDPAHDRRLFRIAALDYETSLFAPYLSTAAPGGPQFQFLPLIRRAASAALLASEIDLAIGYSWERPTGCESALLYQEDYAVVARAGHPALKGRLTLARYAGLQHVLTAPGGSFSGIVDKALAAAGYERRIAVAVPYFLAALSIVAHGDLVATVPRRLAHSHVKGFGLSLARPPLPVRAFPVRMSWNRRGSSDPALLWLRDQVEKAARQIAAQK